MSFKPGNKIGRQFTSTNQPKKTGRKPALFKQLANIVDKEVRLELSREDFIKLQRWLLERTKTELMRINRNPETPLFIIVLVTAILEDIKNGKYDTIERTFDRVFGRSIQPLIIDQVIETDYHVYDFVNLDDEDLEKIGEILKKVSNE